MPEPDNFVAVWIGDLDPDLRVFRRLCGMLFGPSEGEATIWCEGLRRKLTAREMTFIDRAWTATAERRKKQFDAVRRSTIRLDIPG